MTEDKQVKRQMRIIRSIASKLGDNMSIEDEYQNILKGESKLNFRERQWIVLVVARQEYLKQHGSDTPEVTEE